MFENHQPNNEEATPLTDAASLNRGSSKEEEEEQSTSNNRIICYLILAFMTALILVLFNLQEMNPLSTRKNHGLVDYPVIPRGDFGPYKEYSVIHTDRSLNLMSDPFQHVMRDLNLLLKTTFNADKVAIIPGYVFYSCL